MKIIITNNTFYPYQRGGAEKIVRQLAEDWSAAGHQVMVVALKPKNSQSFNEEYTNKGYQVNYWSSLYYDLANYYFLRKLLWHLLDWLGIRYTNRWLKILQSFKPDLVVANNLTGLGFSLHFCCQRLGIKSVQIFHDIQYLLPDGLLIIGHEKKLKSWPVRIYKSITAFWFASAKLLVSPSNWLIDCYRQNGWLTGAQWQWLPNPITACLPAGYRLSDKLRRAIFVGQLTEAKGVLWLVDQWSDFNRQLVMAGLNEVDLVIVGDGPLKNRLKQLANQDSHLILLGQLSSEQVKQQLQAADVLLMPSFCYENWPTVLIEAATVGCPAIVVGHGGAGELAEKLNYLTFQAGNLKSLLETWYQLNEVLDKLDVWPANDNLLLMDQSEYLSIILRSINV